MGGDFVLLVDNDVSSRERIRGLLARAGLLVLEVGDGWEALACLHRPLLGIRLVITDLDLPALDGRALIHMMRAEDGLRALPVIIIADGPVVCASHDPPVLRKPVNAAELYRLVDQLLAATGSQAAVSGPARPPGRLQPRR
jgi:CheY-like chemotaxis protein